MTTSSLDPLASALRRYPALAGLEHEPRLRLARAAIPVRFPTGSVLFRAGSACEGLLLVLAGEILVALVAEDGHEILLYRVEPGETCVLSTTCLLGGRPYPAEGVVAQPVEALFVPAAAAESLLGESAVFRRFLLDQLGDRLAGILALVSEVAFRRTDARLSDWLAEQAARRGTRLAVTHQEIAKELGTAREVVSRLLKELERRGLVRLGRGLVEVLAPDRLLARDEPSRPTVTRSLTRPGEPST
ncbi:MAG: Crp/Fnr family transcriptional regulator [Geminicoccaceae bacterium]|nr:Crp/Fnr family transcriptional regulator [Geminicoccaceae bacterium]MCX8101269.1 Crp/Fnr family transcriptional regulator [Geminicoccaceae bacterium]MDW8371919.1 Crp/Fnr family transcriptional regulator [Geminicoccaceae bacterium]